MKDNLSPKLQNLLGDNLNNTFKGDKSQLTTIGIPIFEAIGGAEGIKALGGLQACIDLVKEFGDGDLKAGVNYIRNNSTAFAEFMMQGNAEKSTLGFELFLLNKEIEQPTKDNKSLANLILPTSVIEQIGAENLGNLGSKLSQLTEEDIKILSEIGKERITQIGINNIIAIGLSNISEAAGILGKISIEQLTKLSELNYQTLTIEEIRQLTPEFVNKLLQIPKDAIDRIGIQNALKLGLNNLIDIGFNNIGNGPSQITPEELLKIGINSSSPTTVFLFHTAGLENIKKIGIDNIEAMGGITALGTEYQIKRLAELGSEKISKIGAKNIIALGGISKLYREEDIEVLAKIGKDRIDAIGAENIKPLFASRVLSELTIENITNIEKIGIRNLNALGGFANLNSGSITVLADLGKNKIEEIGINNIKELIKKNLLTKDILDKIEAIGIANINALGGIKNLDEKKINRLFEIGVEKIQNIGIENINAIGRDFDNLTTEQIDILSRLGSEFIRNVGIDKIKELGFNELDVLDPKLRGEVGITYIKKLTKDTVKKITASQEYNADSLKACFEILHDIPPNFLAKIGPENLNLISRDFLTKLGNNDFKKGAETMSLLGVAFLEKIGDPSFLISLTEHQPIMSAKMMQKIGVEIILAIPQNHLVKIGKSSNPLSTDNVAIHEALTILEKLGKNLELIPPQYLAKLSYANLQELFGVDLKGTNINKKDILSKVLLMAISNESGIEIKDIKKLIPAYKANDLINQSDYNEKTLGIIATFGASNIISIGGKDFIEQNFDALNRQAASINTLISLVHYNAKHPFLEQEGVFNGFTTPTTNTGKLMYRMNLALHSEIFRIYNDKNIPWNEKNTQIYKIYHEKFASNYAQLIAINAIEQPSLENVKSLKEIETQLHSYEEKYPIPSEQKYTIKNSVTKEMLMEPLAYVPKNYSKLFQELDGESNTKAAKLIAMGRDGTGITESQTALERGLHRLEKITKLLDKIEEYSSVKFYIEIGYENIKKIGNGDLEKGLNIIKSLGAENIAALGIDVIQQLGNGNVVEGLTILAQLESNGISNLIATNNDVFIQANSREYEGVLAKTEVVSNFYNLKHLATLDNAGKTLGQLLGQRLYMIKAMRMAELEDSNPHTSELSKTKSTPEAQLKKKQSFNNEFAVDELKLVIVIKKQRDGVPISKDEQEFLTTLENKIREKEVKYNFDYLEKLGHADTLSTNKIANIQRGQKLMVECGISLEGKSADPFILPDEYIAYKVKKAPEGKPSVAQQSINQTIIIAPPPQPLALKQEHQKKTLQAVTAPIQQKPVNELEGVTLSKDLIIKIGEERIANYLNSSTSPMDKKTRIENVNGLSTLPEYKINELPKMQDTLYEIFQNNLLDYIRDPSVSTSTRATSTSSGVVNTGEGVSSASHRFRSFTQSIGDLLKPLKQFTTTTQTSTTADVSSGSPSTRTNDLIKAMEDELKMFSNSSKQPVVDAKQGTGSTDPNINHDSRLASYNPKPVKFGSPTAAASTLSNLQANQQQHLGQEKPQQQERK